MAIKTVRMVKMKRIVQQLQLIRITKPTTLCQRVTIGCSIAVTINVCHTGGNVTVSMIVAIVRMNWAAHRIQLT